MASGCRLGGGEFYKFAPGSPLVVVGSRRRPRTAADSFFLAGLGRYDRILDETLDGNPYAASRPVLSDGSGHCAPLPL